MVIWFGISKPYHDRLYTRSLIHARLRAKVACQLEHSSGPQIFRQLIGRDHQIRCWQDIWELGQHLESVSVFSGWEKFSLEIRVRRRATAHHGGRWWWWGVILMATPIFSECDLAYVTGVSDSENRSWNIQRLCIFNSIKPNCLQILTHQPHRRSVSVQNHAHVDWAFWSAIEWEIWRGKWRGFLALLSDMSGSKLA